MMMIVLFLCVISLCAQILALPVVINTWPFTAATESAWKSLVQEHASSIDAIVAGCSTCEKLQCDHSVGYGGSPDENGETTLDAMIMDGSSMNVGAVANLRRIRDAIAVAKYVLENTEHSILAGDQATEFAKEMGFTEESLQTDWSKEVWENWRKGNCQPNYWSDVFPDHAKMCGPYHPQRDMNGIQQQVREYIGNSNFDNHDTISMVIVNSEKNVVSGTSTNGATHKIPGRVGDGPIVGAGSYADSEVGGCGATGDGDVMMRFLPCYQAVESMRLNKNITPQQAAEDALSRIGRKFPGFHGGLVVVDREGNYGAAGWGWNFSYSVRTESMNAAKIIQVPPIGPNSQI
jgi:N4-(beta-N-acetylglucosaminyl)-L-asparaginase